MMTRESEDHLFARFRQAHDLGALAELFDRVAPQLLQVARHLVRDPHAAEDLVQQTFVAAIEDPAGWDQSRPVVPWLAGVLANRARRAHRDALRAPDLERLDAKRAASPDEAAIAAEIADTVRRAIESLPGTYRPVVDLHLQEGLKPREIAGRLARPAGRIRVQLLRGLNLLRRALPDGLTAGVFGRFAPPRGLAAIRSVVLQRAALLTKPPHLAAGVVGVWLVGLKLWLGAGVVAAVALAAWWTWPPGTAGAEADQPVADPVRANATMPDASPAPARGGGLDATPRVAVASQAAPAPAAAETGTLVVQVRWGDDRQPAEGITVVCAPAADGGWTEERSAQAGADGRVTFAGLCIGTFSVSGDRGGTVKAQVRSDATTEVELLLPNSPPLDGVVVDLRGTPAPDAVVTVSTWQQAEAHVVAHTDASGRFRVRGLGMLQALVAHARGYAPSTATTVPPPGMGSTSGLRMVLGPPTDVAVRGVVLGIDGRPAADARVAIYRPNDTQERSWVDARRGRFAPQSTRTDAVGQFEFAALTPGPHLLWARAPGTAPAAERVLVGDQTPAPVTMRLVGGATLRGTGAAGTRSEPTQGTAGDPEPGGLRLDVEHAPKAPTRAAASATVTVSIQPELALGPDLAPSWVMDRVTVAADGSFCAPHIGPGRFRAALMIHGQPFAGEFTAHDGEQLSWDVAATRHGPVAGQLVDPAGEPLSQWEVLLQPPPSRITGGTHATTDKNGRFAFPRCEDIGWQILARPPRNANADGTLLLGDVRVGVSDLRLVVPSTVIGSAFVTGQLTAEPTLPAPLIVIGTMVEGGRSASCGVDAHGVFRLGPLPAGSVRLTAGNKDFDLAPRILELRSGATLDAGTLTLLPRCTLRLRVLDAEGQPVRAGNVAMRQSEGDEIAIALVDGIARRDRVGPGRYTVRLLGADAPIATQTIAVEGQGEVTRELRLPAAVARRVRFTAPSRAPATLTFVWRDANRAELARDTLPWPHRDAHEETLKLVAGRFELTVTDAQGNAARTAVVIGDLAPSDQVLELRLP